MKKIKIEINKLPALRQELMEHVKAADPKLEEMRFAFLYKDESNLIHIRTAFDFLDMPEEQICNIAVCHLYQLLDEKSSN